MYLAWVRWYGSMVTEISVAGWDMEVGKESCRRLLGVEWVEWVE